MFSISIKVDVLTGAKDNRLIINSRHGLYYNKNARNTAVLIEYLTAIQ